MIVDGVRPGDEPLEVVVEQTKPSLVRLRASAPKPLSHVVVRVCYRTDGSHAGSPWLPLCAATPWSHAALPTWSHPDGAPIQDEGWRFAEHRRAVSADGGIELWLDGGPAWLAVSGHGKDGEQMAPVTTGAVTIAPGEIVLSVQLSRLARLCGRVEFGERSERFPACVAIADGGGRLLNVAVLGLEGDWHRLVTTSSHGHFALSCVPGTWELRVGTRAELERGEARLRRRVEFVDGVTETIVLRL